ncbi:TPA: hypothetical protein HA317_02785 [Candidatus Woesearchaeota archaeon]|nr:hypothetical protein [Candidatus Woesearchaeota archaeon]
MLVAGAVILLFFGSLIYKLRSSSEQTTAVEVVSSLDTLLTSARVSAGTIQNTSLGSVTVGFECNAYTALGSSQGIRHAIFAPKSLSGQALLWAEQWQFPFHVTNFLYLSSNGLRSILVFSEKDSLFNSLVSELPDALNLDIFPEERMRDIRDHKELAVRLIFLGVEPSLPQSLRGRKDSSVSAVRITPQQGEGFGRVTYYRKEGAGLKMHISLYYIDLPSLVAALISDPDVYECSMQRAFESLNRVAGVYIERNRMLADDPRISTVCGNHYKNNHFEELAGFSSGVDKLDEAKIRELIGHLKAIELENEAAQADSCPLLY